MVSPVVGAIASFFIPGLGQYLGGQGGKKAIIFFVIAIILSTIFTLVGFSPVYLLYAIYAAYDAYSNIK
ncbi:hypothetical protein MBCUT_19940 [Methanobrevibacter cuticularis]|uniref:TM2 domain protein n=1 Tax=Methanobrevibacter cuticularis TaxID=47311 RepID=A0A166CM03_9EURY|nr:hypothetical protein [Methanobrevibacter cuticularis]KZX14651.1 hypothetical protein MBCUT_19940 [Methanobrevibacter cuticularis]